MAGNPEITRASLKPQKPAVERLSKKKNHSIATPAAVSLRNSLLPVRKQRQVNFWRPHFQKIAKHLFLEVHSFKHLRVIAQNLFQVLLLTIDWQSHSTNTKRYHQRAGRPLQLWEIRRAEFPTMYFSPLSVSLIFHRATPQDLKGSQKLLPYLMTLTCPWCYGRVDLLLALKLVNSAENRPQHMPQSNILLQIYAPK